MSIYNEPPPGMCIVPDKEDITKVCVWLLIILIFSPPAMAKNISFSKETVVFTVSVVE